MVQPRDKYSMIPSGSLIKGGSMDTRRHLTLVRSFGLLLALVWCIPQLSYSQDPNKPTLAAERREGISLSDAALKALQSNLDISISRHTKESRLTDIIVEQAKFDPTFSVN